MKKINTSTHCYYEAFTRLRIKMFVQKKLVLHDRKSKLMKDVLRYHDRVRLSKELYKATVGQVNFSKKYLIDKNCNYLTINVKDLGG